MVQLVLRVSLWPGVGGGGGGDPSTHGSNAPRWHGQGVSPPRPRSPARRHATRSRGAPRRAALRRRATPAHPHGPRATPRRAPRPTPPRGPSRPCRWTLTTPQPQPLIIPNAHADARFANHPYVKSGDLGFYAGTPLLASNGHRLGTLWVHLPALVWGGRVRGVERCGALPRHGPVGRGLMGGRRARRQRRGWCTPEAPAPPPSSPPHSRPAPGAAPTPSRGPPLTSASATCWWVSITVTWASPRVPRHPPLAPAPPRAPAHRGRRAAAPRPRPAALSGPALAPSRPRPRTPPPSPPPPRARRISQSLSRASWRATSTSSCSAAGCRPSRRGRSPGGPGSSGSRRRSTRRRRRRRRRASRSRGRTCASCASTRAAATATAGRSCTPRRWPRWKVRRGGGCAGFSWGGPGAAFCP
jgi:hypothetical protein